MVKLNIYPRLPERVLKLTDENRSILEKGVSVQIDLEKIVNVGGYGEGQERLIRNFAERESIMPPLWVLAHAFMENEEVRYFLDQDYVCTSSAYKIKQRGKRKFVDIGHQVMADPKYDALSLERDTFRVDKDNYGLVVPVPCRDYPMERTESFEDLIKRFPRTAEALFLMNQEQLHRLLGLVPKIGYDQDEPGLLGELCSVAIHEDIRYRNLYFGGRVNTTKLESPPSRLDADYLFGVCNVQFTPIHSYSMNISEEKIDVEQEHGLEFKKEEIYSFWYAGREFKLRYEVIPEDPSNPNKNLEWVHLEEGFGEFDDESSFRKRPPYKRTAKSLDPRNLRLLKKLPEHVRAVLKI